MPRIANQCHVVSQHYTNPFYLKLTVDDLAAVGQTPACAVPALLQQLLSPLCLGVLLLLVAGVLYRRVWLRHACVWSALLILLVAGNDWVGRWAATRLERRYSLPDAAQKADAILVLGDLAATRQWPEHVLDTTAAGDRAVAAFDLFRQGRAPLILCSGGKGRSGERALPEAEETRTLLESFGVPEQVILVETNSTTLVETARECRRLIESKHIHRLFLVGTARHLPMATAVFWREVGSLELLPVPVGFMYPDKPALRAMSIIEGCLPTADHLFKTEQLLHEYLQLLYYRLGGRRGEVPPFGSTALPKPK